MISITAAGDVIDSTPHAQQIIDRFFPENNASTTWQLPDTVRRWIQMNAAQKAAADRDHRVGKELKIDSNPSTLFLRLIPEEDCHYILLETRKQRSEVMDLVALGLTHREAEVLRWTMMGKRNSEVADILEIKVSTARKHMEHILEKLDCETRGAAALRALEWLQICRANYIIPDCLSCVKKVCTRCALIHQ
jgi:DNA-binding CsgD family transcriptional regulator